MKMGTTPYQPKLPVYAPTVYICCSLLYMSLPKIFAVVTIYGAFWCKMCHDREKALNVLYYMPQSLIFVIVLNVPTNNVHSVHVVGSEKSYRKDQFSLKSSNFQSSDPPTKQNIWKGDYSDDKKILKEGGK